MTDAELARIVLVADQAILTAQQSISVLADALRERLTTDPFVEPDHCTHNSDGSVDQVTCPHANQIKVIADITICDECGVNLKAGVPIDD